MSAKAQFILSTSLALWAGYLFTSHFEVAAMLMLICALMAPGKEEQR